MSRLLRFSHQSYDNLNVNRQHVFARKHALNIYPSNSIYSFIPKNGCSTMRTSLAIANGCIADSADFNWIHQNNDTFSASLSELAKASYTFTILRCPYSRLLSVYLDKILERTHVAWRFIDLHDRKITMEDISFEFFVRSMCSERIRGGDIHWMPQTNFLIYEQYDEYFAFEDFPALTDALREKIGLVLVDARPLTRHGRGGYKKLSKRTPYRRRPFELLGYKMDGYLPSLESMYNDELVKCVRRAYKADIALYKKIFGPGNLLYK